MNFRRFQTTAFLALAIVFGTAGGLQAQTLAAADDGYGMRLGEPLMVEPFGVLDNDLLDGENAGESGATASLVSSVSYGILECPDNTALELCEDGSFTYTPDASFTGLDSFTYEAVFDTGSSIITSRATVTLTACTGGPDLFTCWQESAYTAKLTELGFGTIQEGFEGAAWQAAREPDTAPSVSAQDIRWTSNHPTTNEITTGIGPALSGVYGLYDPDHGFATGTPQECDINNPPAHCLFHDGWTGTRTGGGALQGAGAYFTGTIGANIAVLLDGGAPIGLGRLLDAGHFFFGVISTTAFSTFKFQEMDGKVGQSRLIFGDDFVFGTGTAPVNQVPTAHAGADQTVPVGVTVTLDGSGSGDADGDPLVYQWYFVSKPPASTAALNTVDPVYPTFGADQVGSYTIELVVDDGIAISDPDTVVITAEPDSDGDLVSDSQDNCTLVANADQRDTDGDGYGNLCDGDLNNDSSTNTLDLHLYRGKHSSVLGDLNYDIDADFNNDGTIDALDLDIYKGFHRLPPGPSCCGG